jgi:hypothetical protein
MGKAEEEKQDGVKQGDKGVGLQDVDEVGQD